MSEMLNRRLKIRLILDNAKFPTTDSNIKELICNQGYGFCSAETMIVKKGSGYSAIACQVLIHGMNFDDCCSFIVMQQKSNWNLAKNSIEIYAGDTDDDKPLPLIYKGNVLEAMFTEDPLSSDGGFFISALQGGVELNEWSEATSISGDISFILKSIIAKSVIGYTPVISKDVQGNAKDVVLEGNWRTQLNTFCQAYGLQYKIDIRNGSNIVMVAPQNKPFSTETTPLSQDNLLIDYPSQEGFSIKAKTWYDNTLIFGQIVKLKSIIYTLDGDYIVNGMVIHLSNNSDAWFNTLYLIGQNK